MEEMTHCDYPGCKNTGGYDMEVCNENNENETVDVDFCRKHYIETMIYNGLNPENEGVELTDAEKQAVYEALGIA